jgi:hypothetical protein
VLVAIAVATPAEQPAAIFVAPTVLRFVGLDV